MSDRSISQNKLGTMKMPRLIMSMSAPLMLSMFVQALYNIVDSIYVAQLSETALTATSLAFPLQTLMIGFAVGTGVGANSLMSRSLGAQNDEKARSTAYHGVVLEFCTSIVFMLIGLFLSEPFIKAFTDDPVLIDYSVTYLKIVLGISFGAFLEISFSRIMQSTGDSFHPMIVQLTGAIINIILDPIMIFGYLGCPAFGIAGAAYATVIGQICAMILAYIFVSRNKILSFTVSHLKGFRFNGALAKEIYQVGLPSIVMQCLGSVTTTCMNLILVSFSATAVAVYGAYFKVQSFVFMPTFGLNGGLISIIGYNYGARNIKRIHEALKLGIIIAFSLLFIGFLVFELFPEALLSLFNASENMVRIGVPAFRRMGICFLMPAFSIIPSSLFQACGKGTYAMYVSLMRQIVFLVPLAWLFSLSGNLDLVWFSVPLAEIVSCVVTFLLYRHLIKKPEFDINQKPLTEAE